MRVNGAGCPGLNPSLSRTVLAGPGHSAGTHATSLPCPLLGHKQGNEVCDSSQGVIPAALDPGLRAADARDAQHIPSTSSARLCVCVRVRACGGVAGPPGDISKLQVPLVTLPHGPPKNRCCRGGPRSDARAGGQGGGNRLSTWGMWPPRQLHPQALS